MSTPDQTPGKRPYRRPRKDEYIDVTEYRKRLPIIQSGIYQALSENDQRFGGSDGIEGVLVFGSYAKSYPIQEGKSLVHIGALPYFFESDLDIATISEREMSPPRLSKMNVRDYEITKRLTLVHGTPEEHMELVTYPDCRLEFLLQEYLLNNNFPGSVSLSEELYMDTPEKENLKALSNGLGTLLNGHGLLFVSPASPLKDHIVDLFRRATLATTLDPATEAIEL